MASADVFLPSCGSSQVEVGSASSNLQEWDESSSANKHVRADKIRTSIHSKITNATSTTSNTTSSTASSTLHLQETLYARRTEFLTAIREYQSLLEDTPELDFHDDVDTLADQKIRFVMGLVNQMNLADPEVVDSPGEKCIDALIRGFQDELHNLRQCVEDSVEKMTDLEKELCSMKKQVRTLKEAAQKREFAPELMDEEMLREKSRRADQVFREHKKILHKVIQDVFPEKEEEMIELLGSLCEKHFNYEEEEDAYITLTEDDDYSLIESLIKGHVVKRHPYNERKIKLAEM